MRPWSLASNRTASTIECSPYKQIKVVHSFAVVMQAIHAATSGRARAIYRLQCPPPLASSTNVPPTPSTLSLATAAGPSPALRRRRRSTLGRALVDRRWCEVCVTTPVVDCRETARARRLTAACLLVLPPSLHWSDSTALEGVSAVPLQRGLP